MTRLTWATKLLKNCDLGNDELEQQPASTFIQCEDTVKLRAFFTLLCDRGATAARDVGQIPSHSDLKIPTGVRTAKSPSGTSCRDKADGYRKELPVT